MKNSYHTNRIKPFFSKILTIWLVHVLIALSFTLNAVSSVESEEEMDRQLGILFHPWKIFLPESKTLHFLRSQATSLTGLPNFAQQPQDSNFLFLPSSVESSDLGSPPAPVSPDTDSSSNTNNETQPDYQYIDWKFQFPLYDIYPIGNDNDQGPK